MRDLAGELHHRRLYWTDPTTAVRRRLIYANHATWLDLLSQSMDWHPELCVEILDLCNGDTDLARQRFRNWLDYKDRDGSRKPGYREVDSFILFLKTLQPSGPQ